MRCASCEVGKGGRAVYEPIAGVIESTRTAPATEVPARPRRTLQSSIFNFQSTMIRPVRKYGAPELRRVSSPVEQFDIDLENLVEDLKQTMYAEKGVGLAAPQIGVNLRVIVVDVTIAGEEGERLSLVNPEIVDSQGSEKGEEGCLSIPGFTAMVERPSLIKIRAQAPRGELVERDAEGLLARVISHEIDHLDGLLYLDRISRLKRDLIKRKIRKLVRAGEW